MSSLKSYEIIWNKVIFPLLIHYDGASGVKMSKAADELKKDIWKYYTEFNEKCKTEYMSSNVKKLDRHKVSACYIFAILKSEPFVYIPNNTQEEKIFVATEQLAISVGFSILRSFLLSDKDRKGNLKPKEQLKKDKSIFKKGLLLPDSNAVEHGAYRDNFAVELYFTRTENNYNILSLSHSLYLLEMYNRMKWQLDEFGTLS